VKLDPTLIPGKVEEDAAIVSSPKPPPNANASTAPPKKVNVILNSNDRVYLHYLSHKDYDRKV
jgi:hypothetical protein